LNITRFPAALPLSPLFARLIAPLLLATLTIAPSQAEREWVAAATASGVALSYRDDPTLDAREVRAIAELPHDANRIIGIVCDFTQVLDPDVRQARVLAGEIGSRYEIYLRYASRFVVVSARDVVIDVRRRPGGCDWSEIAGRLPPQSGTVRMPLLRGSWTVDPIDASRSRVTYQIAVRPGGRIPGWMVRRGAINALPQAIARLSRCLSTVREPNRRCPPLTG
jgi:hypothetical protein